jgi:hypothetical protein
MERSILKTVEQDQLMMLMIKPKLVYIIFKNSVRTAKKTQRFTITNTSWLMPFWEITAVYSENHTKHINELCEQNAELLNMKARGTPGL